MFKSQEIDVTVTAVTKLAKLFYANSKMKVLILECETLIYM